MSRISRILEINVVVKTSPFEASGVWVAFSGGVCREGTTLPQGLWHREHFFQNPAFVEF